MGECISNGLSVSHMQTPSANVDLFSVLQGSWQEYYQTSEEFGDVSPVTLSTVGTIALALNYGEMLLGIFLCRKFPTYIRAGMWACLVTYCISLVIASFANHVWMLIVFQGIVTGTAGGLVYAPIYVYVSRDINGSDALYNAD